MRWDSCAAADRRDEQVAADLRGLVVINEMRTAPRRTELSTGRMLWGCTGRAADGKRTDAAVASIDRNHLRRVLDCGRASSVAEAPGTTPSSATNSCTSYRTAECISIN